MVPLQRARYRIHTFVALGICLLLLSSLPPHSLQAATKQQEINNAIADFKDGQFQRAALANVVSSNPNDKVADQVGGVQLGPVGVIKSWKPGLFTLPKKLYNMGAVAIGSRIFIVGGRGRPSGQTVNNPLADVWSVAVSTLDGSLLAGWQAEPALPAVQNAAKVGQLPTDALIAPIESAAVTATTDASGQNGTIYVIGGNATSGILTFSSYAVRIGTVVNGRVTGWQEQVGARLPAGIQEASAVTAKVGNTTYVYLLGGLRRELNSGGTTISTALNTVYYARVGAGGKLFKPSSPNTEGWDVNPSGIPVPDPNTQGLWDMSAVADNYVASTQQSANAIYLVGGQLTPQVQGQSAATYSSTVYQAQINNDGTLSWSGWTGQILSPRSQTTALSFRGNLYIAGGVPNANNSTNPDAVMLTSYVEDDLTLHQFTNLPPTVDGEGLNFLQSKGANDTGVLPQPRKLHGSVLVRAGASSPNAAFMFVLGGIGASSDADTSDDNGADTVFYGKVGGGDDVESIGYASNGWYYGLAFDVAQQFSQQVQVQEIDWTTLITDSSMDIALEYRLSSSNDCANATWDEWLPLDGEPATPSAAPFSVNGQNTTTLTNISARCFQYRARLSTTTTFATPLLLNVSVKINIPGSPDLSPKTVAPQYSTKNAFLGLNVVIQNRNTVDPPTLAADVEKKGSFFVDICIFKPGATVVAPTYPLTEQHPPACSTAYANVNRSFMPANTDYTITQWLDSGTNKPVNLLNYFNQAGSYTVIVVVDSFGYVDEGVAGGEANNIGQQVTFSVAARGYQQNLTLVKR